MNFRVEIEHPIVGEGLDQHHRTVGGQRSFGMLRRAHGVAHVVQTVKETDQVKTLGGILAKDTDPLKAVEQSREPARPGAFFEELIPVRNSLCRKDRDLLVH